MKEKYCLLIHAKRFLLWTTIWQTINKSLALIVHHCEVHNVDMNLVKANHLESRI